MNILQTPAACSVQVDGELIKYDISYVELKQYVDDHHVLKVRIRDVGKVSADQDFDDPSQYTGFLGKPISVNIKPSGGTVTESRELSFVGLVTEIQLENSVDGINIVRVIAKSPTVSMDGAKCNAFFHDQGASDIISSIIGNYQITKGTVDSTSGQYEFNVQKGESDYEYLMRLATAKGLFAFYDGSEFRAVKAAAKSSETEELIWRETLGAFTVGLGTTPPNYASTSYNYVQSKSFTQDSESLSSAASISGVASVVPDASKEIFPKSSYIEKGAVDDAQSLDESLKVNQSIALGGMVRCSGQSIVPAVAIGHCIKITGMDQFDSQYWVTELKHVFDEGGKYHNEFVCSPVDTAAPQYKAKRKPATSLQSAVVVDNNDPDGLGRIKVKFHWLDGSETCWLRVVSPHAGNGHGWVSLPEIDDEVLVGFENGNPNYPVALGSLYTKDNAPPDDSKDSDNNVKMFITKGGNVFSIGDAGGSEAITLSQGDNSLVLSLDGPKITIESKGGDISIKAANIKMEADQNFEVKSGQMKLDGGQTLEITGMQSKYSGQMVEVSGSMVKIN